MTYKDASAVKLNEQRKLTVHSTHVLNTHQVQVSIALAECSCNASVKQSEMYDKVDKHEVKLGLSWSKLKFRKLILTLEFTTSLGGWVVGGCWVLDYVRLMLSQLQLMLELKFKLSLATSDAYFISPLHVCVISIKCLEYQCRNLCQ